MQQTIKQKIGGDLQGEPIFCLRGTATASMCDCQVIEGGLAKGMI
jgi:hypothetical protein